MARSINKVYKRVKTNKGPKLKLTSKEVTTNTAKGSNVKTMPVKGNEAKLRWQKQQLDAKVKQANIAAKTANTATVASNLASSIKSIAGTTGRQQLSTDTDKSVSQNTNGGISDENSDGRNEWIL